jgi:integrase
VATIRRNGKSWQAIIRRLGFPAMSRCFPLKSQALEWAVQTERDLLSGRLNPHKHTVADALTRYEREVSPKKRGARWETLRLRAFARDTIAAKPLSRLTEDDIARWRERRLQAVSGATVRREMNLWQSLFEVARKEWKWIERNPVDDVKKPPSPKSRRRGVTNDEIDALRPHFAGPVMREVFEAFRLGVETAMRAGEMISLDRGQIDLRTRVAHLLKTKNGDERDVPLSPEAVRIIERLLADGRKTLFHVSNRSRDVLFRKGRDAAGIEGLNFHDSRSEGISRLSKKMDVLELARVVGHRDPKSLMFYYRADAAAIARRLADPEPRSISPPQSSAGKSSAPKVAQGQETQVARRTSAPAYRRTGNRSPHPRGSKGPPRA